MFFGTKNKKTEPLKTHNLGGCVVTRSLLDGRSSLKWLFREEGCNPSDNGWRALGDTDTQEYIDNPDNSDVVDFDRLVEIEPAVLGIYELPVGTDLEFIPEKKAFIDAATGKEIKA